jgi:hypothetical protein
MSEMSGGPKIEYHMPNGFTSDAYLDDDLREDSDIMTGVDKHTDVPVTVRWTGERWVQLS